MSAAGETAAQNGRIGVRIGDGARHGIGRITADQRDVGRNLERGVLRRALASRQTLFRDVGAGRHVDEVAVDALRQRIVQRGCRLPRHAVVVGTAVGLDVPVHFEVFGGAGRLHDTDRLRIFVGDPRRNPPFALEKRLVRAYGKGEFAVSHAVLHLAEQNPVRFGPDPPRQVRLDGDGIASARLSDLDIAAQLDDGILRREFPVGLVLLAGPRRTRAKPRKQDYSVFSDLLHN